MEGRGVETESGSGYIDVWVKRYKIVFCTHSDSMQLHNSINVLYITILHIDICHGQDVNIGLMTNQHIASIPASLLCICTSI